ncbi:MAG: hypothetical protein AAF937_08750 [Planctomycetota bacterium]
MPDLSSLDRAHRFVIKGIDVGGDCGVSVSLVGDVHADGVLAPTSFTAWVLNFNAGRL